MITKCPFSAFMLLVLLSACSHSRKVEIVNHRKHQVSIILSRKATTQNTIPYDSSFFEKGYECRMTRIAPDKSLLIYSDESDSAIDYEKLGFDKIQIESSTGHINATYSMIPSLFHKNGNDLILEVK